MICRHGHWPGPVSISFLHSSLQFNVLIHVSPRDIVDILNVNVMLFDGVFCSWCVSRLHNNMNNHDSRRAFLWLSMKSRSLIKGSLTRQAPLHHGKLEYSGKNSTWKHINPVWMGASLSIILIHVCYDAIAIYNQLGQLWPIRSITCILYCSYLMWYY